MLRRGLIGPVGRIHIAGWSIDIPILFLLILLDVDSLLPSIEHRVVSIKRIFGNSRMPIRVKSRRLSQIEDTARAQARPRSEMTTAYLPDIAHDDSFREVIKKLSVYVYFSQNAELET